MGAQAADLLIVGGGPAGMMAGLLFARAGVKTLVIETHADFLRDFRGDTVPARVLGLGVRREHIRSPDAGGRDAPQSSPRT